MERNLKLTVAYDGTDFLGWQKTPMGPSIEAALENAASTILRHPVQLQAASRTDAGVHASGQIVNLFTPSHLSLDKLKKGINALLPPSISIVSIEEAPASFHPTLDAQGKTYLYSVCLGPAQLPIHRRFSWHFGYPLDLKKMEKAAALLEGKHDFSAFTNELRNDNRREIFHIDLVPLKSQLKIRVSGNNFLYKMVRNIAGTLLYVGCEKLSEHAIPAIIASKDRTRAGVTAPAHGLTLQCVIYDESK